jgi:hypothetical protein
MRKRLGGEEVKSPLILRFHAERLANGVGYGYKIMAESCNASWKISNGKAKVFVLETHQIKTLSKTSFQ